MRAQILRNKSTANSIRIRIEIIVRNLLSRDGRFCRTLFARRRLSRVTHVVAPRNSITFNGGATRGVEW